jgi:hypothetical protein
MRQLAESAGHGASHVIAAGDANPITHHDGSVAWSSRCYSVEMEKHKILVDAKAELERHVWGTFVEGKASVALGGTGVIVSGCEACRKRFGTNSKYLRHLSDDVLPSILRKAFEIAGVSISK